MLEGADGENDAYSLPFHALPAQPSPTQSSASSPQTAAADTAVQPDFIPAGSPPSPSLPWYRRHWLRVVVVRVAIRVIAVCLIIALVKTGILPFSAWLRAYLDAIECLPLPLALLVFAVCSIPFSAFTPGSYAPTLAAGVTFPIYLAFPLSYVCMNAAALLNVAVIRSGLCCACVKRRVSSRQQQRRSGVSLSTLQRLYLHHPVRTVILLRLPYLASGILNYTLAFSSVSLRHQLLGNAVGFMPGAFLFSVLGGQVKSLWEIVLDGQASPESMTAVVVVSCLVLGSVVGIGLLVRKKTQQQAAQVEVQEPDEERHSEHGEAAVEAVVMELADRQSDSLLPPARAADNAADQGS